MNLGLPLSPQQKQLAEANPEVYRWAQLDLSAVAAGQVQQRLTRQLQRHEALRLRYDRPLGATGLRQHVVDAQLLRLEWRQLPASDSLALQREAEVHLRGLAADQRPDVLAWLVGEQLLLALPVYSLDSRSINQLRAALISDSEQEPEMQYPQYAEWVNGLQQDEDAEQGVQFWRNLNFQAVPGLRLIERYGMASGARRAVSLALEPSLLGALNALAKREHVAVEHLALAAWGALLGRLNGQQHAQFGVLHDPRDDYEELEGASGLFEQTLPLMMQLSPQTHWLSLTRQLSGQLENAVSWQEYVGQASLLPDWRASHQAGLRFLQQADLHAVQPLSFDTPMELLLQWTLDDHGQGSLTLIHDSGLYRREQMELLLRRYRFWLAQLIASPQAALHSLSALLVEDPRVVQSGQLLAPDQDLISVLRDHARTHPARPALRDGDWLLSYAQLDELSDIVAGHLHQAGAGPEQVVGLYLPRGAQMLIAMLACFKAGAAYLPLDPQQPPLRLLGILEDAKPCLVIHLDSRVPDTAINSLAWADISQGPRWQASTQPEASQLAYVLYTSGTSGKPKGVQIEHGQLRHYVTQISHALDLPQAGHYGLVSSLLADLGNTVLYPAWQQGGCVHLLAQSTVTDAQAFAEDLARYPLDVLKIVPSHLEALMGERSPSAVLPRQVLVLGGEPISEQLAQRLLQAPSGCRIYNHYGPTETTVGVLWRAFDAAHGSLGAALNQVVGDNRIYLLDQNLQPVPAGQPGELYVAGSSVGRGYVGGSAPGAFGEDPFAGGRCYRTGDLALRQADGALRILGRNDQQVKIRGFRLELAEIEQTLLGQSGVLQAAVIMDGEGEHGRLLAFIVEDAPVCLTVEQRQTALAKILPDYMLPAAILGLKSLPLNANGKLDRRTLLDRARQRLHSERVAPVGALETAVLDIWCSVLGVEDLGVTDNFFSVGGHSLAAIKVVSMIRERLSVNPPTNLLFERQTVRELVRSLDQHDSGAWKTLQDAPVEAPVLLLIHGAQGHLQPYQRLVAGLSRDCAVYGLSVIEDAWHTGGSVDALLERYVQSIAPELKSRPLNLLGWSLASRLALLLVPALQAQGFTVNSLLVLDHDPRRSLAGEGDEAGQLLADLGFFCRGRGVALSEASVLRLSMLLKGCGYAEGVQRLQADAEVRHLLGWQTEDAQLVSHLALYRRIKVRLYEQTLPVVKVPIRLWRNNAHGDLREAWQALSLHPLRDWTLDVGHHEILDEPRLIESLHALLLDSTAEAPSIS
jgi:amino acid adenylation domain-containing protein